MGKKGKSANARNSDPTTSHIAARDVEDAGTATSDRERCLEAVQSVPGRTSGEVAQATGLDRHTVSKRLPELRERHILCNGASRVCQANGTMMMTWWPADSVPAGQEVTQPRPKKQMKKSAPVERGNHRPLSAIFGGK